MMQSVAKRMERPGIETRGSFNLAAAGDISAKKKSCQASDLAFTGARAGLRISKIFPRYSPIRKLATLSRNLPRAKWWRFRGSR
jgi:hypothetical protein